MIKILVSVLLMVSLGHVVLSQSLMERADASQIMAYVKVSALILLFVRTTLGIVSHNDCFERF